MVGSLRLTHPTTPVSVTFQGNTIHTLQRHSAKEKDVVPIDRPFCVHGRKVKRHATSSCECHFCRRNGKTAFLAIMTRHYRPPFIACDKAFITFSLRRHLPLGRYFPSIRGCSNNEHTDHPLYPFSISSRPATLYLCQCLSRLIIISVLTLPPHLDVR